MQVPPMTNVGQTFPGMQPPPGSGNIGGIPGLPPLPNGGLPTLPQLPQLPQNLQPPPGLGPPGQNFLMGGLPPGLPQPLPQGLPPGLPQGLPQGFPGNGALGALGAFGGNAPPTMVPPPGPPPGANPGGGMGGGIGDPNMQFQQLQQAGGGGQASNSRSQELAAEREREGRERRERTSREQAAKKAKQEAAEAKKCHLHKKPKAGCKFCQRHQDLLKEFDSPGEAKDGSDRGDKRGGRKPDRAISEERDSRHGPLELTNTKTYGFSGLLQTHIVECAHFKSLLTLETFEQLIDETFQFANGVEPYMANSGTLPSALFCCLYRFFTLALDARQLRRLIDSTESPFIRCCGFLYIRFGLPHDHLLSWMAEYLCDDEEFQPSPDSDYKITIGEYVEGLMSQDKYYSTVLPRLPMVTKRHVEEKLAPVIQYRKRTKANKELLDAFREQGARVEAVVGTEWLAGKIIELEEDVPTRLKVRIRLDDGSEEYVHIGKVILADGRRGDRPRRSGQERNRSPTDWSRTKGRSAADLLDEMRSRDREKAVCSSGKDYARKPVGYKAACALPREQGQASYRLMEEETFVPMARQKRARTPSPERESFGSKRQSAEHQARMQALFEKYGTSKGAESANRSDEVDRPDVVRLG